MQQTLKQVQQELREGSTSCKDLVEGFIRRIAEKKELNAFLEVFNETAIERANFLDAEIAKGNVKKLTGLVVAIKDNICYAGHKVSAASKILDGFESTFSATVVSRLLEEGAIIVGRLNCDEFAMGSSNENSSFGPVHNPLNQELVPGGSSGGAAAAVAADLCMAALGSDTGGSIRQPAAFCGVVGMKPTYGRVSRNGLIAYASSFDQIGPITQSVEDAAIILEVIAGKDEFDSTASRKKVEEYSAHLESAAGKKKIGYFPSYLNHPGLDAQIKARFEELLNVLQEDGHEAVPLDFDHLNQIIPAYYVLTTAEASSNLARYDGIHFGYRSEKATDIESTYKNSRTEGFGEEVQRRIMLGTYVLSEGYYDAYYGQAQKVRRVLKEELDQMFEKVDFILTPTTPHTAFAIGEQDKDPIKMYLEDIFTAHFNLTGNPAISIPMYKHENGMPIGIQVAAQNFDEANLFAFGHNLLKINSFNKV